VVGAGPNGLAAGITLARAGHDVTLLEAADSVGGGARSAELTLPGYVHDVCSAIYPFARLSPFFKSVDLEARGLQWITPTLAIGHPLDREPPVILERDLDATAQRLGEDADTYRRLIGPLLEHFDDLLPQLLAPFHLPITTPITGFRMARFGLTALQSATSVARRFKGERARALWAGAAAHAILPLTEPVSAAAGLMMLATAHAGGWPLPAGGAGQVSRALADELNALGGRIQTSERIEALTDLPEHDAVLFDVAPGALATISGDALPGSYRDRLAKFRHGPGVFKLDIALDGPIPWRDERLAEAGTIHLGGTLDEVSRSELDVAKGRLSDRPFVLLTQPGQFDSTRAPAGKETVWAYCHVPNGSAVDMTQPILGQIERFAPGFRDRILAQVATGPAQLEESNANYVGGDIACGRFDLGQLFTRPSWRIFDPYSTPNKRIYICSAATPPGAGVHGMGGFNAARSVLRRLD
jgi:phytoene dehydrogenase-like protein